MDYTPHTQAAPATTGIPSPARQSGVELGRFRLRNDGDEAAMRAAWQQMVNGYLSHQAGWQGQHLLKLADGVFIDLALAESQQRAEQICALWQNQPLCNAFLALIEPLSMEFASVCE